MRVFFDVKKTPLQMHIIIAQLDRVIRETGRGLAAHSEQALEGTHQDFSTFWRRFFVNAITSDIYSEQLLRATQFFNIRHIPISLKKIDIIICYISACATVDVQQNKTWQIRDFHHQPPTQNK